MGGGGLAGVGEVADQLEGEDGADTRAGAAEAADRGDGVAVERSVGRTLAIVEKDA